MRFSLMLFPFLKSVTSGKNSFVWTTADGCCVLVEACIRYRKNNISTEWYRHIILKDAKLAARDMGMVWNGVVVIGNGRMKIVFALGQVSCPACFVSLCVVVYTNVGRSGVIVK